MNKAEKNHGLLKQPKLLVVDDEVFNRSILIRYLNKAGFEDVDVADNGHHALEQLRTNNYDLVMLDIEMPLLNGFEVLAEMREDTMLSGVPVIMVSGLEELDSVVKCVELGVEDYLFKPLNPVLLHARVNSTLEKKRLRDAESSLRLRAEKLLQVILPGSIVEELHNTGRVQPRRHENVAILIGDVVSFTPYSESHSPEEVISALQEISDHFETITENFQMEKLSSVGDSFMAIAGFDAFPQGAVLQCVSCALNLYTSMQSVSSGLQLRLGVHIGPVVGGVVGTNKFVYGMFGDAVNTADRMQSLSRPGVVCLSADAWNLVEGFCVGESQGFVDVKGKGQMEIFYVDQLIGEPHP